MKYTKQYINNTISNALQGGLYTNDILGIFLSMKMANDLGEEYYRKADSLSPNNLRNHLLGNGVIDDKDIKIEYNSNKLCTPRLVVQLLPSCKLYGELVRGVLQITVNDERLTQIPIRFMEVGEVASWIIRQKQNLGGYLEEWETVQKNCAKKAKSNRMALLAIKAIFTEAMKEYPNLEYVFIEQKRRVRIRVKLPNCNLGVFIDGWWGSYKKRLPEQIADLKFLIEAHSKTRIKDFFVARH